MSNPAAGASAICPHHSRQCLNPFELVRKYRCNACGGVMMCACDETFGRRFLAHQLGQASELDTQKRIPVTLGFLPSVCAECRGLPTESVPVGEIHGRTSKIKRYYWRELFFEETRRLADWGEAHPSATEEERRAAKKMIDAAVLEEVKQLHATAPKYVFSERSQAEVLERNAVEVLSLAVDYVPSPLKGAQIRHGDATLSPEQFVARHFEAQGWTVLPLESRPFHALFGVMMWLMIQDPNDPRVRFVGFGDRAVYEAGTKPPVIWTPLPEDFGAEGYAASRREAVERHFEYLPPDRGELLWVFDYWRPHSADLRQYLWAHRSDDVDRARKLVEILPPDQVLQILRYLLDHYWGHYLGWPDLLLHRGAEILFVEVKSSNDRLSEAQKRWIGHNHDRLHLPFKLVKLHRNSARTSKR
jgi:hypothetical protein